LARENLDTIVISLSPMEIVRVKGIVFDKDKDAALKFLIECLGAKIDEIIERPH